MNSALFTVYLLLLLPQLVVAQSWEFNVDGDSIGWWAAHSVGNLWAAGGSLVGDVTGDDPYIIGPPSPYIDANTRRYICIRMKVSAGMVAEFFWQTAAEPYHKAGREVAFSIYADNQFHEYTVDMSTNSQWTGLVNTLRLDPSEAGIGSFEVDYIRVVDVVLDVSAPSAQDRFAFLGEQFAISAIICNLTNSTVSNVRASLTCTGQTILTPQPQIVSSLVPGQEAIVTWQARADIEMVSSAVVSVAADEPSATTEKGSLIVVSRIRPSLSADAPSRAQTWTDVAGNVVIENPKLRMALYRSSYGFGVGELYVRNGASWDLVAASSPQSRINYLRSDGTTASVTITPSAVSSSRADGGAELRFSFTCPDTDGGSWRGTITYFLGDTDEIIKANFTIDCSAARNLTAWTGPSLCSGNRSFGPTKTQALFPGLEWLVGDEKSSDTLESRPPANLRVVPHPYKVTVPVMAVSGNGSIAGLLWNSLQKWDGANAYPSAKFSSPNRLEAQNNHLMELFVPSVPYWVSENSSSAGTPYSLAAEQQLAMECYYFVRQGGEVLDTIDKWYALFGTPPMPGGNGLLESGLTTARTGFMSTIWDESNQGWPHAVGWDPYPYPEFAADIFADSLTETNPSVKEALRSRVSDAVQKAISLWGIAGLGTGAGSHIPGYRLPYFVGHLSELARQMQTDASSIIATQQPDGGWFVPVNASHPELTQPGTKELGSCSQNAYFLLRHARISGSNSSRTAGTRALNYMNGFIVPRAAQVWEVPQHAPDILAAAWAVAAYLEGYLATGVDSYLTKARYWARAGLPFVYAWRASNRQIMDYATIPVFGSTFFTYSWFGLPVQWCGMVYAYYIERLADYDSSVPWRSISEGITRSCIQQMNTSPYLGTYPDSMNILYSNTPNPAYINPDNVFKCASELLGGWGEIDVRKIVGPHRTAYLSTSARILLGCFSSDGYQLTFKVSYPVSETCNILIFGTGGAVSVYKGSQPLTKVSDVDTVAEGWSYDTSGCIVIKEIQGADPQTISVLIGGTNRALNEVEGPAQVKALPDGALCSFRGLVTAGTDNLQGVVYIQSEDRVAGIRISPATTPLIPIRIGDKVEAIGSLSTSSGERYISRADVRIIQ